MSHSLSLSLALSRFLSHSGVILAVHCIRSTKYHCILHVFTPPPLYTYFDIYAHSMHILYANIAPTKHRCRTALMYYMHEIYVYIYVRVCMYVSMFRTQMRSSILPSHCYSKCSLPPLRLLLQTSHSWHC